MHVVYLIDSLVRGGAEQSLADLAPHYVRLGVRLDVAYLHDRPGVGPDLEAAGASLFSLAGGHGRMDWARRAVSLLQERGPDVLHTTLFESDIAGRISSLRARVPVVTSLVNLAYGHEQLASPTVSRARLRGAQLLDAVTARRVARFHAVSTSVADVMSRRLRISRDRIDVIPRGRDTGRLGTRTDARRTAARTMLGIDRETPMILAAGREEFQKGFDVLIRAFGMVAAQAPNARLFIAGRSGGDSANLRRLADALGLAGRVEFLGLRSDVPELLCAADVFAFPSRWEGLPGGVLEAMALETPIVASAIAPVRELVEDRRTAWLVPPEHASLLGEAVVAALRAPDRTERTNAARARFLERYTIERVADEMVAFYLRATNT